MATSARQRGEGKRELKRRGGGEQIGGGKKNEGGRSNAARAYLEGEHLWAHTHMHTYVHVYAHMA